MNEYRLHIDIPLGADEKKAEVTSKLLIQEFLSSHRNDLKLLNEKYDISQINYRLGHDEDRQKSNYLNVNDNGHVSNKKIRITMGS